MNLQWVRDNETNELLLLEKNYNGQQSFECFQYTLPDSLLSSSLTFKYSGAFPVVLDTDTKYEWEDWMGAIAINNQAIRASNQSAWHPIIFSLTDSLLKDKMSYDLDFICEDFGSLYVSGNPAFSGKKTKLISGTPVHLMLFAGNYEVYKSEHLNLLNTSLSPSQVQTLDKTTQEIIAFYETWLGIDYGDELTFIETATISKNAGFSFFSYPTITFVECDAWGMESMFEDTTSQLNPNQIAFIAHEIGHYYIGTRLQPKGNLFWFINEGLTEFMALHYVEKQLSTGLYNTRLANYVIRAEQLKNQYTPLCEVTAKNQLDNDNFRYNFAPLLFAQMQKEFGEKTMRNWIVALLNGTTKIETFAHFEASLTQVGIPTQKAKKFTEKYLCGPSSLDLLISNWKKQPFS